jgi:hypothetical protein
MLTFRNSRFSIILVLVISACRDDQSSFRLTKASSPAIASDGSKRWR